MFTQILRRFRQWLSQIWDKFNNWINPPLPKGYNPPRLPDHEYEWLFKQLLAGVSNGWTRDKVIRWLKRNEYRVSESQWLEWLPRFEDTAKEDREIQRQLLLLAQLGCGQISQAAGM